MNINIQLENLNLMELNILLGHLRLGEYHLKNLLGKQKYTCLLAQGSLNSDQNFKIQTNRAEKSGNIALVLNTVITSIFGAWMGFSGFLGLHLNSVPMLITIILLALFVSITVGFLSFKLTTQNSKKAIHNQKIHNLQLNVLELMVSKKEEVVLSLIKYLNYSLRYVQEHSGLKADSDNEFLEFNDFPCYEQWTKKISSALNAKINANKNNIFYNFYCERLIKIIKKIENIIQSNQSTFISHKELLPEKQSCSNLYTDLLANPVNSKSMPRYASKTWLRAHFTSLLGGLIPTFLGSFASMFVFLSGGPNVAREFGKLTLETAIRQPNARLIEFSLAISLTLYYSVSFIYNNFKMYLRDQEIEKTRKIIMQRENELFEFDNKYNTLIRMKNQTTRIINIFTAMENIRKCLQSEKRQSALIN